MAVWGSDNWNRRRRGAASHLQSRRAFGGDDGFGAAARYSGRPVGAFPFNNSSGTTLPNGVVAFAGPRADPFFFDLFQFFFWELPATTGFYQPFDFEFEEGSFFIADPEDATSLIPQTQAQTLTAVHSCFEKMKFASPYHDHVAGSWPGS